MGELFPVDLTSLFREAIASDKRAPDGKLHASSDLVGSLRHTQLRAIGAPERPNTVASQIRLMTGTLWHRWLEQLLHEKGVEVHTEVNLTEYLPPGWSGTADYVFSHPDYEAFVLGDLKTAKGEGIFFINRDGAKEEHIWQLSAYFWALVESGLPMVNSAGVLYIPINDVRGEQSPEPSFQELTPLDRDVVWGRMEERAESVEELRKSIASEGYHFHPNGLLAEFDVPGWEKNTKLLEWITAFLAPEQERLHKLVWDSKKSVFNVVLTPHWSAAYCDWDTSLCSCRTQGQTKIGHYDLEGNYTPRKGYELDVPLVEPTGKELNARRNAGE